MSQRCVVVVDSSASIPDALVDKWNVYVVPLEVIIDGEPFSEGPGMTSEKVMAALERGSSVTTSQPSVGTIVGAYWAAAQAGAESVVSVHISDGVSGTVNSAKLAAQESPIPVEVVDSKTLAMGLGFSALAAATVAKAGAGMSDVAHEAKRVAASSSVFFTVDTLEYLRKGGRVPPLAATVGEALSLRPILSMVNGEVGSLERVRTTARARERVLELIEEKVERLSRPGVAVTGLRIASYVGSAASRLLEKHPQLVLSVDLTLSAALAVHGGPGSFVVAAADLPRALE